MAEGALLGRGWLRGTARIEGGFVTLDRDRAGHYSIFDREGFHAQGLLIALAGVRVPLDILPIVKRYGLLWHGPDAEEHRESLADWERVTDLFRSLLRDYSIVRGAAAGDLDALAQLRKNARALGRPLIRERYDDEPSIDDLIFDSNFATAIMITNGLQDMEVRHLVLPDVDRGFVFVPAVKNLEGFAWHELALIVTGNVPLESCLECRRFFTPKDQRQRYCSPQCSGRARYRRFADKKRSAKEES